MRVFAFKFMKKDIFDLLVMLEEKSEILRDVFGDIDFLDREISFIWNMVYQDFGIDKNNDHPMMALGEFGGGRITKQQLIKILKKYGTKKNVQ